MRATTIIAILAAAVTVQSVAIPKPQDLASAVDSALGSIVATLTNNTVTTTLDGNGSNDGNGNSASAGDGNTITVSPTTTLDPTINL